MEVYVVIPNFNGEGFLKECLDSLKSQSHQNFKVIFVDNGSSDNSIAVAKSLYDNIEVIQLDKNYGFSRAVNEGIKLAITDKIQYTILLNNDTVCHCDFVKNLICCIEKEERIFSCSSKMIQYYDRTKIDDAGDQYTILGWAYKRGDGADINDKRYCKDSQVFSSCGGAAIYRTSVFETIGLFDERFFAYMEDVDVGFRANLKGYKNMYCCGAEVYHVGSGTSSGKKYSSFKVKLAARNNLLVIFKNMPRVMLFLNAPFIFLGCLIKFCFMKKNKLGKEYIEGIKEGIAKKKECYIPRKIFFLRALQVQLVLLLNLIKCI